VPSVYRDRRGRTVSQGRRVWDNQGLAVNLGLTGPQVNLGQLVLRVIQGRLGLAGLPVSSVQWASLDW